MYQDVYRGNVLDPSDYRIDICVIAKTLSHICRFGGRCKQFISVAQHSVLCHDNISDSALRLSALMHDAAEFATGDFVRALKEHLYFGPNRISIECFEDQVLRRIETALKIEIDETHPAVVEVDNRVLLAERRVFLGIYDPALWKELESKYAPIDSYMSSWTPKMAEKAFLHRWREHG